MFLLPIILSFMVLFITILVVSIDHRVYSRNIRLDEIILISIPSIVASGIISLVWFLVGVR